MPVRPNYPLTAVLLAALMAVGGARGMAMPESADWLHRAWQTEDGLPDNSVTGVAQTSDGFLWVATKGGLLRFNGEEFTVLPQANLPPMPSRVVRVLLRDRHDQLWLSMERGPLLCLQASGVVAFTAEDGLLNQRVIYLAEDHEGAIWLAYPGELRRIKDGKVTPTLLPDDWASGGGLWLVSDARGEIWFGKGTKVGVYRAGEFRSVLKLNEPPVGVCPGAKSGLWILTGSRVLKYEEGKEPVERGRVPDDVRPLTAFEDQKGVLWVGTGADGLFRLEGSRWEKVTTSHQEVTCLTEDREGNIWAGTAGGGVNLIRPRTVALIGRDAGLPFESVLSVSEDTEGWLWAASQEGALARGRNGQWELMSAAADWPGGNATCVAADRRGGVWVGTSNRGLKHYQNGVWRDWLRTDGLISDTVRSLLVATNGDLWVASAYPIRLQRWRDGQVTVLDNSRRIGAIRAMAESSDGTIWIGTSEGEIQRVSGKVLVDEPGIQEPIPLSIRSLLATPDGSLWIGYAGDGLGRFRAGQYHRLTTAAGLADDFVSQLLADGNGNLWIAGNRGLSRIQLSELNAVFAGQTARVSARSYGRSDGLPGFQPNRDYCPAVCRGRDGRLWFSTRSGLLMVEAGNIRDNPEPPPVRLERVTVDDQTMALYDARSPLHVERGTNLLDLRDPAGGLRVAPGHRKLEIEFAALSFASPENVQFRYRLGGFDRKWTEAGPRHHATYPQLPAGDYEFRVLACNNAGVWNETGAALALVVSPFFWETWWFRIGGGVATVIAAGGSVFLVSRRRYRQKLARLEARRALEHERSRIAKDIHDDLGASLTHIILLSQGTRSGPEESDGAVANLQQIHTTARQLTHSMEEVVWAVNPEHDTFDGLANYLSNYAQGFLRLAGVRCRLEMPMQLPAQALSAEVRHNLFLAFKEALNNVVKHAQATEVRISLHPGKASFELLVEDNGRGFAAGSVPGEDREEFSKRAAPGNGLANMRSRLQEIGGRCEFVSQTGVGTKVEFSVPLKQKP